MDVSEIIDRLDAIGFEDTADEDKMDVINDTVWDIDSRALWPYLEKTVALDFDGSSPTPTNLPADFKSVIWLYDTTNGITLWPERLSTIRDRHGTEVTTTGDGLVYYFVGSNIRLWPVPSASTGRYQLDYFASQPELTTLSLEADILLPKRHHRTILLGALWRLYKNEDDPEQGTAFQSDFEDRISQMRADLFGRQHQRADQIFVIDEDDEYYV